MPESFFNKVTNLRPPTLLKKKLWHMCFPVTFTKFLEMSFLTESLRWYEGESEFEGEYEKKFLE